MNSVFLRIIGIVLSCVMLLSFVACDGGKDNGNASESQSVTGSESASQTQTETESETESETEEENMFKDSEYLKADKLSWEMNDIFGGKEVRSETLMFIDYGDSKQLLYTPDEIISVTSYDGKTVYREGVDYSFSDGKITILEGSSMPCITSDNYYDLDYTGTSLYTMHNGERC